MRLQLSEAILLGSTMIRPKRGVFLSSDLTQGCAFGMANRANGGGNAGTWPWTMVARHAKLPCDCRGEELMAGMGYSASRASVECCYANQIVHLFNQHVIDGSWTIEQLADWVRSIEPPEQPEAQPELTEAVAV
jgi:hypothetical protein